MEVIFICFKILRECHGISNIDLKIAGRTFFELLHTYKLWNVRGIRLPSVLVPSAGVHGLWLQYPRDRSHTAVVHVSFPVRLVMRDPYFIEIMSDTDLLPLIRQQLNLCSIVALGSCHPTLWKCRGHYLFIDLLKNIWQQSYMKNRHHGRYANSYARFRDLLIYINTFPTEVRLIIDWAMEILPVTCCWFYVSYEMQMKWDWMSTIQGVEQCWDQLNFELMIRFGELSMAQWMYKPHFVLHERCVEQAFEGGHFHILLWLLQHKNKLFQSVASVVLIEREDELPKHEIRLRDLLEYERARAVSHVEAFDMFDKLEKGLTSREKVVIIRAETLSYFVNNASAGDLNIQGSLVKVKGSWVKVKDLSRKVFNKGFLCNMANLCTYDNSFLYDQIRVDKIADALDALHKLMELNKLYGWYDVRINSQTLVG